MKKDVFINPESELKTALEKLNKSATKVLLVVNPEGKLLGTLTDGDIRRFLLKNGNLNALVKDVYNPNPVYVTENSSPQEVRKKFLKHKVELLPVLDPKGVVKDYITWTEAFSSEELKGLFKKECLNIPVVIMAGGKGTRLAPITKVIPKPLVPLKGKTMIEHVIETFTRHGAKEFHIIVNYKGELIEAYFNSLSEKNYSVNFVREKEFLGTAGSLKFLEPFIGETFIVSNCDILLNVDYCKVLEFHQREGADFTSLTVIKQYRIPYGVVKTSNGGHIEDIEEKPELLFQVNAGVYILSKEVLKFIKPNEVLDMPQLIKRLLEANKKVVAYPIKESDYIDMGQWEEYFKANKLIERFLDV